MGDVAGLGAILTAIVTPFDDALDVDEQAFVDLLHHLSAHGSDGFVVCGTTGEASTLSDEEHLRVVELAVQEKPEGVSLTAGGGAGGGGGERRGAFPPRPAPAQPTPATPCTSPSAPPRWASTPS